MSKYGGPMYERYGKVRRIKCIVERKSRLLGANKSRVVDVYGYDINGERFGIFSGWDSGWSKATFLEAAREWYGAGVSVSFEER